VIENGIGSNKNYVFTVYNPVLTSLTPAAAPPGGLITLNGSGFGASQSSSTVKFNGITADIYSWSDAVVKAYVPLNASSGPVTVIAGGVTSNGVQFTVETISITSIAPTSGPYGSSVTITGAGFGSTQSTSTAAFFGVAATTITSWSDTQIVALVPAGTGTGPITVTVAGIIAWGPTFTLSRQAQLTDSLGDATTYTSVVVGGMWQATAEVGPGCASCTDRGTIYTTYDGNGNVLTKTDALGHTTTYTYDSANNVTSVSQPAGGSTTATTTSTYNSFGEVLTVTDPLGHTTTNAYDTHGNLTSVTSPAPNGNTAASVTQFAYDTKGELTQITDPLGHITTMTYTPAGLIATITDAQNNVTSYQYDAHGNRTRVTDALQHQTNFAYDAGDRLKTITYPDSTTTTFTYDSRGRRTSVTDQNGKTTTYTYDDADRLIKVTDAANNVTQYVYDTEDNLTTITDANSHSTLFTYDAFGRITNANFPSTFSETYAYDAISNLTSKTNRKGQTITYVYDALNRLTHKGYPDSTGVDYMYDLVGKIQQVNDPTGTYASAYDNMGRLIGTTTSYSFLTGRSFTNAYTYDAASNRTGFTDPESGSTTYAYDTLNRLTTLGPPSAFTTGSFGFSYDALGRRTQMTRPNSVTTNYTYDNLSRLLSVLHQLSGSTIDGASYTVDAAGNRTAKTNQAAGVTSNYTYDAIYQLTQVMQGINTTESYSYDPVGNRLASLGVSPYAYNAANELTSKPGVTYTYDNNGNTLTKVDSTGTASYAWDFENRLTSVTLPGSGGTVTFKYDSFGRRIYKSSSSGTSIYAYDGNNLVEETNAAGAVVARYEETQTIDEPLAQVRSGTATYYEADGLGSITSLTNSSGVAAATYTYDSFGKLTASAGSVTNPFQYTAREFDTETGLYYYRARHYDPTVGRFISEDPHKEVLRGLNFYAYVRNNPVGYTDPDGKSPWDWWDKLWGWLGFGRSAWNAAASTMDWSLCGLYYVDCLNQAAGIKKDIGQALNSPDPVVYATALATLAQQTGSNSMSQLNVNVCMHNENCQKALLCAQKGLTSPLPFPVTIPVNH
jgi:RHS repeat-associated protein